MTLAGAEHGQRSTSRDGSFTRSQIYLLRCKTQATFSLKENLSLRWHQIALVLLGLDESLTKCLKPGAV